MNKHHWKRLFFLLAGVNLAVIIFVWILISIPIDDSKTPDQKTAVQNGVDFQIKTNKEDLNRVINHYLEEEFSGKAYSYKILLSNEVELYGAFPLFNENIKMKLTFEPKALENGDLLLNQKNVYIGKLKLPVPLLLKFVRDSYPLPDWVKIQPNEKKVYVSLQDMKLKSDFKVKVNKFDLKNDDIVFSLQAPMN